MPKLSEGSQNPLSICSTLHYAGTPHALYRLKTSDIHFASLTEAGISVIVASMPTAAKAWQRHMVGSVLYNFVKSKFKASKSLASQSLPSDFQKAKANAQKRRGGLYSIATFLMSFRSSARTKQTNGTGKATRNVTELSVVRQFRQGLDQRFAVDDSLSLQLDDPSKPGTTGEDV